jgi:hypothetical protein
MANQMYKGRLVIAATTLDKETGKWIARITVAHTMYPPLSFDTEQEAEAFGLKFATDYIDERTKTVRALLVGFPLPLALLPLI